MGCAPSSRAVSSCLVKRPLPITLLPFLLPNSASRRSRSPEVGQRGGVGGAGPGAAAESGLESQLPLCLPGSKEATTMLHMLTLLKDLLPCFPEGLVKSCSETLLRVMTLLMTFKHFSLTQATVPVLSTRPVYLIIFSKLYT